MKSMRVKREEPKLPEIIIETSGLEKSFIVGERKFPVLNGINVRIVEGDFLVIYGPSGSGKSTLLNCLIGLEPITLGKVWVGKHRLDLLDEDERSKLRNTFFGVVYQQQIWVKALSVAENVALPLMIRGHSRGAAISTAMTHLREVGMERYAGRKPTEISGGEQQRVGLARALLANPRVLVLDEPTGNLDTHSADQVLLLLQRLNRSKGMTVIMVTHNMAYLPLASRTIRLRDGMIEKEEQGSNLLAETLGGSSVPTATTTTAKLAKPKAEKKTTLGRKG
jgi:ABC-type lipoprotein export system ATPase subunit